MRQISLYILIILLLTSCYKDYDNSVTEQERELPETTMESGLTGRVLDTSGNPLTSYSLVINGQSYTHQQEYFYNDVDNLRKYGQIIFIEKDGEKLGFANALLVENDINYAGMQIFPDKRETIISGATESITISNLISLDISRGQLLDSQNTTPTGDIDFRLLSVTDRELLTQVGNFGYDDKGGLLTLESSELFYIDFSDNNGDKLSIAEGNPITARITNDNLSLLRLDPSKGYWDEIYNATSLVGPSISESGYYLLAESSPAVYSQGTCIKQDRPVSYIDANYNNGQNNELHNMKTTSKGQWAIATSSDIEVNMSYMTPCGDALSESTVIISEESREDYVIQLPSDVKLLDLSTEVIDCDGELSMLPALSVVEANNTQNIYVYNTDGIETWLPVCSDGVDITGYDIIANNSGALLDWNLDINDAIGYLSYCEDFENGFSYINIRDDHNVYDSPMLTSDGMSTLLEESENRFRVNFFGNKTGSYDKKDVKMFLQDTQFGDGGYRIACESTETGCGFTDFNVTHFNVDTDGWTRVSFSGSIWMQTLDPPLAGDFDVTGVIMHR